MNRPSIETIHSVMIAAGMKVFESPYSVTLGGVRTKDSASGKFNDWLFASYFTEEGGLKSIIVPGTTDSGLYYRENPLNRKGTAVIKHNIQHRGSYQYQNPKLNKSHRGHKGQEAFKQIANMEYWRDNNKDSVLDYDGETQIDNNATNGHDMGTVGNNIGKWSAGCWGSIQKNMDLLYATAKEQIKAGHGDIFSYALLHEDMF
tara:strand:+ start:386 stop:994 length:609 start_codon:yes stop_codon:yes gene_type:complete